MRAGRAGSLHAGRAPLRGAHGLRALPELFVVPPVMIYRWISAGDESERERGGKGKYSEEEHLKRSHAKTG